MNEEEIKAILQKIESEMNGDAEHDAEVLDSWAERYRGTPGAEPLIEEIGRRIFSLALSEDEEMPEEIFEDMAASSEEIYAEALSLIEQRQYDRALGKLGLLMGLIRNYRLPEDTVWMDFTGYLEALVFQDYYEEEIGDREIGRHPMHPGQILYTYGSLLIETGRPEEALEPLTLLLDYDPVCPKYLFEMAEACKRTGRIREAYDNALWALSCAVDRMELARGYRDLGYCMSETGAFEDAVMLYQLSQSYQPSRQAEAEIAWIRKKTGLSVKVYDEEKVLRRCEELDIPVGLSETVLRNIDLLGIMFPEE